MRRSLFDNYAPQQINQPRLRPNIFARVAQFSFKNVYLVLAFWLLLAVALTALGYNKQAFNQVSFNFAGNSDSQKYQTVLQKNFPSLDTMITIDVSNENTERLRLARQTLVTALEADTENFDLVYAPGTGTYYETHAILYHSLDDIKARVAYAKSLKPLFDAIAEAPTTASLATLVNEVRGSIEQGRDPQGLDELFSESAKSVQALMLGNERQVDWNYVAGLNAENSTTSGLIFAVPKQGRATEAGVALKTYLATLPQDDGTTTLVDKGEPQEIKTPKLLALNLIFAGIAMAAVLVIFAFIALIGDFNLAAIIMVPSLLSAMTCFGVASLLMPTFLQEFWVLIYATGVVFLLLNARFAFALVETHNIARTRESAVMLASQKQGGTILWMAVAASLITLAIFATSDVGYLNPILAIVAGLILGALICLSVGPAIASFHSEPSYWQARDWLKPIFEAFSKNSFVQLLFKSVAVAAVLGAAFGFWITPSLFANSQNVKSIDSTVNILATSTEEADLIIKNLKSVPEAQGVRWLGAFLPQQVDEKEEVLRELKDQFPSITPLVPQDVEVLREHIQTLQESLLAIGNAPATRPALKSAASEFRQSLELLASTSENKELLAFENRIFGSFNVLPQRSQSFADMDKPTFNSFDERLRSLFMSPEGILRLEVTPIAGVSSEELARKLSAQRFHVAHPVLALDGADKARLQAFSWILLAAILVAICSVFLFTKSAIETFVFAIAVASLIGIQLGYLKWLNATPGLHSLLVCLFSIIFFALAEIAHKAQPWRHEKSVETLLPIVLTFCGCLPFVLLKQNVLLSNLGEVAVFSLVGLIILIGFEAFTKPRFALNAQSVS